MPEEAGREAHRLLLQVAAEAPASVLRDQPVQAAQEAQQATAQVLVAVPEAPAAMAEFRRAPMAVVEEAAASVLLRAAPLQALSLEAVVVVLAAE